MKLLLLAALLARPSSAEWRPLGPVSALERLPDGALFKTPEALLRVTLLSPTVVRVRCARGGALGPESSFAALPDAFPEHPKAAFTETASALTIDAGVVKVRVFKTPLRVQLLDEQGQVFLEDDPAMPVSWNGTEFRAYKSLPAGERYFGLGDKAGPLDRRGRAFTLWNTDSYKWREATDPLYKSLPFFIGMREGRAYGLFLDNTYRTSFDFGLEARDRLSFGAEDGELDTYVFFGPDPKKVLQDYAALTGKAPLPPLFALGYQQSRYSYETEARVREVAAELRKRSFPADALYLDIGYQDRNRPFTVDRAKFPRFEEMLADLRREGFRVVAITDLHIAKIPGTRPYDEGLAGDHFVKNPDGSIYTGKVWPGDCVFPDFTHPSSRAWWGTLYREFAGAGVSGYWNDMNEPAVFERVDKTMPLSTVHRVGERKASHREVHNVYGMQNSRATYEGLLELQPGRRPFVLTRATYAGGQRYAASWTGDNSSTWNHLRLSVPTLLSLGLSGFPLAGVDIGGFTGSPQPELLTRWIELGAFNPLFRNHSDNGSFDQEPWVHGPEHEAARRKAVETRYRLMPYLYTSLEETARTGLPLMRPLFLEFPGEAALLPEDEVFLLGSSLLVAAKVTENLEPYEVRLPSGAWYDFRTGERKEGGSVLKLSPALDEVPLFVRAGTVLPLQPLVQHLAQTPEGPLELRIYPGPDCGGSVYADDGESLDYRKGAFSRTRFECREEGGALTLKVFPPEGSFKPWWTELSVTLAGRDAPAKRAAAPADGKAVELVWGKE